jgi:SWI/SNF-related matrix-associated actin-dependent regulator of chromatin subfamily A3
VQLRNISVKLKTPVISAPVRVKLGNDRTLFDDSGLPLGNIQQEVAGVLRLLSSEHGVELKLSCFPRTSSFPLRSVSHGHDVASAAESLSVIIYGPMTVYDEIGEFLQEIGMYLQDPQGCDRDVRYRNPHRLSGLDEDAPMTSELRKLQPQEKRAEELFQSPIDVFSDFETHTLLSETISPDCLATELYR